MVLLAPPVFAKSLQCKGVLDSNASEYVYQVRGLLEQKVEFKDDLSFLSTMQRQEQLGVVGTFFSKEWDTQVFYTQTAIPKNGKTPLVDPDSRAVYVFFHGSGTQKSSGRNFIANMNTLSRLGYSAIAIDMPFHAEGPRGEKYKQSSEFMEWVKKIVTEAKKSGKPVYLAGHSFGPDVILEFISRYPKLADGVVGLSPASFTKELDRWYENFTTKMKFGGDVPENAPGGEWAYLMSKQFAWSKHKLADPTKVNPDMRVRILSGDREEYVPAPLDKETYAVVGRNTYDVSVPLKKLFSNATITIEPGIGHYLFDHVDASGMNVVLRELLAVDGQVATKDFLKNRAYEVANERKKATEPIAM
jgi:pimeloyl-ACP methyl ester carboxylesterase